MEIVTDQVEADQAFRRWTDCLVSGSTQVGYGWVIESSGVVFSNYGHGPPGTLVDEVMLGADPAYRTGVVKIVRPDTARLDKGRLGDALVKPTENRFEADGVIERANLLLEIKTGTLPQDVYSAVGQLKLYPHLIGLEPDLEPVLLVPNDPPLKPMLAAAVHAARIDIYTYAVDAQHQPPRIKFSKRFLQRCGVAPGY